MTKTLCKILFNKTEDSRVVLNSQVFVSHIFVHSHLFSFDLCCFSSLIIPASKGSKSGKLNATLNILVDVFGGKSALEKNSPICAGRYNSTKANEVSVSVRFDFKF